MTLREMKTVLRIKKCAPLASKLYTLPQRESFRRFADSFWIHVLFFLSQRADIVSRSVTCCALHVASLLIALGASLASLKTIPIDAHSAQHVAKSCTHLRQSLVLLTCKSFLSWPRADIFRWQLVTLLCRAKIPHDACVA